MAPVALVVVGVVVMVMAGLVAERYRLFWFDWDEGCRLAGRCDTPTARAVLRGMWWFAGAGFALVLVGVALRWFRLPATRAGLESPRHSAVAQGLLTGLAGTLLSIALLPLMLLGVFLSAQTLAAALCAWWLLQASTVAAIDGRVGRQRTRRGAWMLGLLVSLLALLAAVGVLIGVRMSLLALLATNGVALTLATFCARLPRIAGQGLNSAPSRTGALNDG